jgi:hypothetical protein
VSRGAIWQYSFGIYFGNLLVPRLDEFDRTFTPLNAAVDRYGLRTHPSAGDDWTFKFQQIKLRHVDFSHFLIFKNKYYTRFPFLIRHLPYRNRRFRVDVTNTAAVTSARLTAGRHTMIRHFSPYNFHQTFALSLLIKINLFNHMNENTYWNLFRRLDVLYNQLLTCFWTRFCRRLRWTEQTRKALKLDICRL